MSRRRHASRRYKGNRNTNAPDHNPFSTELRAARDLIKRKQFARALAKLNDLAAQSSGSIVLSRIIALIGDVQIARGRYDDALQFYRQSKSILPPADQVEWLRASMGEVQSLLKTCDLAQAANVAFAAVDEATQREIAFQAYIIAHAGASNLQVRVRPQRASVVATRYGFLFLAEGELEKAKRMFNRAVQLNQAGACRARIGLAELAEKYGDYDAAVGLARDALTTGQCHAKSLSAWPILIRSQLRGNGHDFDDSVLSGLAQATPSVRARAIWTIVKTLRSNHNLKWQAIADSWLTTEGQNYPIIAAEIKKVRLADCCRAHVPTVNPIPLATDLAGTPELSPREWLFAIKRIVAASLRAGTNVDVMSFFNQGIARYGRGWVIPFAHGLFKCCAEVKNAELARPLLETAATLPSTSPGWSNAVFALAQLQKRARDYSAAAELYSRCANDPNISARYQIAARIKRANCLLEIDEGRSLLAEKSELLATLNKTSDFETALDLAQRLVYAPRELNAMAQEIFSIGRTRALAELSSTQSASYAVTILFKLSRREADFGKYSDTIARWTAFSDQKKAWLWSQKEAFWQYLGFVFEAYRDSDDVAGAQNFAQPFLADPSTPPIGLTVLGILTGLSKITQARFQDAFDDFTHFTTLNPANELSAYGFYWLALKAWNNGDGPAVLGYAAKIDFALGNKLGLKWKAALKRAVICLRTGLERSNLPADSNYSTDQLASSLEEIAHDLARLRVGSE